MTQDNVGSLSPLQAARRSILTVGVLAAIGLFAVAGAWRGSPWAHETIEIVGLVAIAACIVGRCWCTLYIGGKKGRVLVDIGPYSLSRNPLYFFSILGAAGFGAQTGSVVIATACALLTFAVFRFVVSREERYLKDALGEPYLTYMATTPRFLPRPRLWKSVDAVEVYPRRVVVTFLDGLLFLLAVPLAEGFEQLQAQGILPTLLNLP